MEDTKYFLGLDIGTDSVGYAVTDTTAEYHLLNYKRKPLWGVTLFDTAQLRDERRAFRTARRRLDRRQQRIHLLQEIFAKEITKTDSDFYRRIKESALFREDKAEPYCLFNDSGFTDREYHKKYPTIHHLIFELIKNDQPHDSRLIYLACAWLLAHRGHFLLEISEDNLDSIGNFSEKYNALTREYFEQLPLEGEYRQPWELEDPDALGEILKKKQGINAKYSQLIDLLLDGKKPKKTIEDPAQFPFSIDGILRLLAGGQVTLKALYGKEEYSDLGSFSLGDDEEKYALVLSQLGDDGEVLIRLKAIYDWAVLSDLLNGKEYLSEAKIDLYEQHKKDLKFLKYFIKKYRKESYDDIFRKGGEPANYVAYSGNFKSAKGDPSKFSKQNKEAFSQYLLSIVKDTEVEERDRSAYEDMCNRLQKDILSFLPKQVNGDNRVIPYQLYYKELKKVLENASAYLPFLNEKDQDGYLAKDKILSIMRFRIPYYVGPLNRHSEFSWIKRKAEGKIYPWNFEEKVDLDASEKEFIDRMTNTCSYLPGEDVLPKHSLAYEKFEVLNEINNLKVLEQKIPVEVKQAIYCDLFQTRKRVTPKMIRDYLACNNYYTKEDAETLSGIDENIKSSLSSHLAFKRLLDAKILTENDVETIINQRTYTENKTRFQRWLKQKYPILSEEDQRYVGSLVFKDFGRLSRKLLCDFEGTRKAKDSGEYATILEFLWSTNDNLSEILLSDDKYTFREQIQKFAKEYYEANPQTLSARLDDMYVSNAVRRPIIRALEITREVVKATGHAPEKIFVEMARGATDDQKGKRTISRRQQILDLYKQVKNEDIKHLSEQLESKSDNELQSEALFLYFLQLGKCLYTGETIDITKLKDGTYNIDHIYPQSKVTDDSILNNKALVLSTANDQKKDHYPIPAEWRQKMAPFWKNVLRKNGLITEEKYQRLVRNTKFTEDERWGFINRQLVETRQSTKIVTALLQEKYPESKIVYVKAGLVSEFRREYKVLKSRIVNDLHHAKDSYLNIVCGNAYQEHYTKEWFFAHKDQDYTVHMTSLLKHEVKNKDHLVWLGNRSLAAVKKTMQGNQIHLTQYAFCRKHGQNGGLFDQQALKAGVKDSLIPRKKDLPTEKYGGYDKATITFFILAKYYAGKKHDLLFVPIELRFVKEFLVDPAFAERYIQGSIEDSINSKVDRIELPFSNRILKINTLFEVDGFRFCLASKGDSRVGIKPLMPLLLDTKWETYIKKLEVLSKKMKENANYYYSEKYDIVNRLQNIELYQILLDKLGTKPYSLRPETPVEQIKDAQPAFESLTVVEQANVLINMISLFGRIAMVDSFVGIKRSCRLSSKLSNWKQYKDVRIIDPSASGIWEKKSQNLLELL